MCVCNHVVHTIPACKDIVKEGKFGNMNRLLWSIGCSLRVDEMFLRVAFMVEWELQVSGIV